LWSPLVDSDEKIVITAIKDMAQESFIAAALLRLGWKVVYRATSERTLSERISEYPGALVIASDDFGEVKNGDPGESIILRGRSHPRGLQAHLNPQSDFELEEILRTRKSLKSERCIPATSATVITIASLGGFTGATTLAISIADHLSRLGKSLLLVDGNRFFPKIASHFQRHNIREQISEIDLGFSLFEARDVEGVLSLARAADNFDFIVIDYGPANIARDGGLRSEDLLFSWLKSSRAKTLLIAREDNQTRRALDQYLAQYGPQHGASPLTLLLTPSKIISGREAHRLLVEARRIYGVDVDLFSRDGRAVEKMENHHSTIALTSPKSPLLRDIARYLERERYS